MTPAPDTWLTLAEASAYAKLSTACLRRAIKRGELKAVRVSGRRALRLRPAWIDEWYAGFTIGGQR